MASLNDEMLPMEKPTDSEASPLLLSGLPVDVLSFVMEFLDPPAMVQFTSTSRFLHKFPLRYETVIRNSVLHIRNSYYVVRRISRLLREDQQVPNIYLPSPLCLLRVINIKRCELCNDNAEGHTCGILLCDVCGEEVMGSELYEYYNPPCPGKLLESARNGEILRTADIDEHTWDMFLYFYPHESIQFVDTDVISILRQAFIDAQEDCHARCILLLQEFFKKYADEWRNYVLPPVR